MVHELAPVQSIFLVRKRRTTGDAGQQNLRSPPGEIESAMNHSGTLRIPASCEAAFDRLQDAGQFVSFVEGMKDPTLTRVASEIDHSIDATVTRKLGSMGQPAVPSKAKETAAQFASNICALFQEETKGATR